MRWLRNSGHHFIWIVPLGFLLESTIRRMAEPDLFFYYALVQRYLTEGIWPKLDPFLYTLPNDTLMSAHQWLGYWIFYIPYQLGGWAGPILFKTLIVALLFLLPLLPFYLKKLAPPPHFALIWTCAIYITHHRFRERVSLFGDLFIVLLVAGLLWFKDRKLFWYSLPFMFLIWAQLHPSWPLGGVVLLAHFFSQSPRTWQTHHWICTVLALLAPLLNPLGVEGYLYPFVFTRDVEPYLRQHVVEWLPLTDSRIFTYYFLYAPFVTLVPLIIWQMWRQRREVKLFELFVFALSIGLCIKSVRFGMLAQVLNLLLLVQLELRRPLLPMGIHRHWVTIVSLVMLCLGLIVFKHWFNPSWRVPIAQRFTFESDYFPTAAVEFLDRAKPKMRIFNSFGFGGFLAWHWQGNPKIFYHGFSTNFQFYEQNYLQSQLDRTRLNQVIAEYDIGIFLVSRLGNDNPLLDQLRQHEDFQMIYQDKTAFIYAKRDPRVFE